MAAGAGATRRRRWAAGLALAALPAAFGACADLGGLAGGSSPPDTTDAAATDAPGSDGTVTLDDGNVVCVDPSQIACGATCVDPKTDGKHCGRCGHDCLGGACSGGICQPIELARGLDIPKGIAIAAEGLYVTLYGAGQVVLVDRDKPGSTPAPIASGTLDASEIAVEVDGKGTGIRLFWGEARGAPSNLNVLSLQTGPTPIVAVAAGRDVAQIAIDSGKAYWAESGGNGRIRKCSTSDCGGTAADVLPTEPWAYGIVIAGGALFYSRSEASGAVRRSTLAGSGATDLIPNLDSPLGLATDGSDIFAAAGGSNTIVRCPIIGCSGQPTFALATNPHDVACDGKNVYWGNGLATGGSVVFCPTSGCADNKPMTLAADQRNPFSFAYDDKAVYWTNAVPSGSVMKIAKP